MANTSRYVKRDELPNPKKLRGAIQLAGTSLPNDSFIIGVPKNVFVGGGAGNVGLGLDVLFTFPFPAKSFNKNGANFRIVAAGAFGSNDDNKRIAVGFDAATLMDTGLVDIDAWGWLLTLYGWRVDATHVSIETTIIMGNVNIDSAGGAVSNGAKIFSTNTNFLTVNNMDTGADIGFLITGESAAAVDNNVTCNIVLIDLVRF